jgi:phosphate transport system substrate-binding protein
LHLGRRPRTKTCILKAGRLFGHWAVAGLMAAALCGCQYASVSPTVRLRITGAQIPTELVDSWLRDARDYQFVVEQVGVPGWSQIGFKALARGECDLACTDRPLEKREREQFGDQDVRGLRVGFYGYALYVNPANPLDSIFAKHITLLFQRKIRDWKELGGNELPDLEGPIHLYGPRKVTRGGNVLMQQARIWFAEPTWEALDSDAEIISRVAADPQGLGFASVGLDQDVRYLGIRMRRSGPPTFPSLEDIEADRYGLAKVIYVYFMSPPSPAVNAATEYLFSERGRKAIERTDAWPVSWQRAQVDSKL